MVLFFLLLLFIVSRMFSCALLFVKLLIISHHGLLCVFRILPVLLRALPRLLRLIARYLSIFVKCFFVVFVMALVAAVLVCDLLAFEVVK